MTASMATGTGTRRGVQALAIACGAFVALVVGMALTLPGPDWNPTFAALVLLMVVATTHPVLVRHTSRSEFIILIEMVAAIGVVATSPEQALWLVVLGPVVGLAAVPLVSPSERMRERRPPDTCSTSSRTRSALLPMVGFAALARPLGLPGLAIAALAGLIAHGLLSHAVVATAIRLASPIDETMQVSDMFWSPVPLALTLTAVALPIGLAVRAYDPDWPLLLAVSVTLVAVSRSRMDRDSTSHRLHAVTAAATGFSRASTVEELDTELASTLRRVLRAGRVQVGVVAERPSPEPTTLWGRLAEGQWVVVGDPALGARWTGIDQDLLDAVLAVAGPQRARLQLLRQTMEAERFASLVLTTAGHDITNRLHTATMAIGTMQRWTDRLGVDDRDRLATEAVRAIGGASAALQDLVAIGASGPDATVPAAEVALFVRGLGPDIHVVCENVILAAPAAVVERAVENLVRNAQRHHLGAEPLEVVLANDGCTASIEVRDRGPGLDTDHVDRLFSPFTQLADDRGRQGSLGLGLFIARGLAESVDGSLAYHPRPGGGAVFTLRVPSVAQDACERVQERVVLGSRPDGHA